MTEVPNRKENEEMNKTVSSAVFVAIAILAAILSATPVLASRNLSGKGVMVNEMWRTEETCDFDSYPVITCHIMYYGSIQGTITGSSTLELYLTITIISSNPLVRRWQGSGTLTCLYPCTVNGKVGTLTLESNWDETTIGSSVIHATITTITGTGDLYGTSGQGTWFSSPSANSEVYTVQLTLP
jgi:hypothetical protein